MTVSVCEKEIHYQLLSCVFFQEKYIHLYKKELKFTDNKQLWGEDEQKEMQYLSQFSVTLETGKHYALVLSTKTILISHWHLPTETFSIADIFSNTTNLTLVETQFLRQDCNRMTQLLPFTDTNTIDCYKGVEDLPSMQKEKFKNQLVIPFQRNFQFQAFVTLLLQTHNAELRHSKKIASNPSMTYSEMQIDLTGGFNKVRNVIKIYFSVRELQFKNAH